MSAHKGQPRLTPHESVLLLLYRLVGVRTRHKIDTSLWGYWLSEQDPSGEQFGDVARQLGIEWLDSSHIEAFKAYHKGETTSSETVQ